jgi:Sigma-70, region 4
VTSPARQPAYLDTEILRLIEESDVSVRLSNALHAASGLPLETVRDYLNAGPEAKLQFLRLPNLGRKSADELDVLVRQFAKEERELPSPETVDQEPSEPPPPSLRELLAELFDDDEFPAVFLDDGVPKRLETCLTNAEPKPLSEAFGDWQASCVALLGQQNVGRQSIVDLSTLALRHIRKRLAPLGFTPQEIAAAAPVILMGAPPDPDAAAMLEQRLGNLISSEPSVEERGQRSLDETMLSFFPILGERERDVLTRRYGYPDLEIETLESIAQTYSVTRERIRQIESKALRRLSVRNVKRQIQEAFEAEKATIPIRLHSGRGYVNDDVIYRTMQSLPATLRIAIDILFKDRKGLLKQLATHWHGGWVFEPLNSKELGETAKTIRQRAKGVPLPNTLPLILGSLSIDVALPAIDLGTSLSVFEGYVTDKWVGPRLRRTVRLHRELFSAQGPMEIRDLVARYHRACPADPCSVRDAIIVMCLAPHLFVELQDGVWTTVGEPPHAETAAVDWKGDPPVLPAETADQAADQTIRSGIREILRRCGPLRFVDLRAEAVKVLGRKHVYSVGPILLTSGTFVRPLPGVYALPDQLPTLSDLAFTPPAFMLNEEQARWLAMARFAGEPFGSFPLWQPAVEYALSRWGETKASPIVWQSLVGASTIDDWPVSKAEKDHWRTVRERDGDYGLRAQLRYPIRQLWPPLHRVFAAMHILRARGSLNWMIVNRVLKRRVDAHMSAGLLGILCLLGVLDPPEHWQMPHPRKSSPDRLLDMLSSELQQTGKLVWDSAIGADLIAILQAPAAFRDSAWLSSSLIVELRSVAEHDPVDRLSVPAENDDDALSFEKLLEDVTRQKQLAEVQEYIFDGTDSA